MTQQERREETSHWMSGRMGVSPGTTGNLGPWSRHPAWGHTVTTNMATIPAMLTVPSVCHVSYALCPPSASPTVPTTPAVPSTVSMHTLPSVLITTKPPHTVPSVPHTCCIHRTCHVSSTRHTHQHTQHTHCAKSNLPCSPYQSCRARRAHHTYCACSVVHLHRKHPRWLCRQRACVCQAIEQERLEGLLLREGAERQRKRRGAERE